MTTLLLRRSSRGVSTPTALAAGLTLVFSTAGCRAAAVEPEKPPRPVRIQAVQTTTRPHAARYSAQIAPVEQVPLAFKASGYVDSLLRARGVDGRLRDVQQGDTIARGASLAKVRDEDYRARVRQAEATVAEATASLAKSRLDLERAEHLFAVRSLTKPDLDGARLGRESSAARLSTAQAELDVARTALRDTSLAAPLGGVVLERRVERGTLVGAGTVGFILGDVRSVKVIFGVPDSVVRQLKPGATVPVTTDVIMGREFLGRITAISPSADSQTRVFSVEITVPNPDRMLKPGMIATVVMGDPKEIPASTLPAVPMTSVVKSGEGAGNYAVFIIENAGGREIARSRAVSLGNVVGNTIEVSRGVRVGDRVITSGASLLKDGETVRIVP